MTHTLRCLPCPGTHRIQACTLSGLIIAFCLFLTAPVPAVAQDPAEAAGAYPGVDETGEVVVDLAATPVRDLDESAVPTPTPTVLSTPVPFPSPGIVGPPIPPLPVSPVLPIAAAPMATPPVPTPVLQIAAATRVPVVVPSAAPVAPPQGALVAAATGIEPAATGERVIYLTFDDGPFAPWTGQILDLLAEFDAHATFFVVGRQAAADPAIIRRMYEEGHGVASHSWSHTSFRGMTWQTLKWEVETTAAALGDYRTLCVRPPYGHTDANTADYLLELGYTLALWNVDPYDWRMPGSRIIADRVLAAAHPEAVVLLHDGGGDRAQTVAALRIVLERLKADGYLFKSVCREAALPAIRGAPVPDDAPELFPFPTALPAGGILAEEAGKVIAQEIAPAAAPAPSGGLLAPQSGETVAAVQPVVGYANSATFEKWQLDLITADAQEIFLALGDVAVPEPASLFTWDTTLYPNGVYTLRLRVVHVGSNYDETFVHVTIRN